MTTHESIVSIHIDKKEFHAPKAAMTGAELKQLAGIDPSFRLFKEVHGKEPDVPVGDSEMVHLKSGDHFYSLPVGRVGGHEPTTIHIDKKECHAPKGAMTGAELKQLAGIDPSFRLFRETPGKDPDVPIGDSELIQLKNGDHFYSLPVGRVGDGLLPSVQAEIDEVLATHPDARLYRHQSTSELWIEVPGCVLPLDKGWSQATTNIVVPVPVGYPTAKPPNFFVAPALTRNGANPGGMGGAQVLGTVPGSWCAMCWGPVAEGRPTLLLCIRFALSRFQEAQ